MALAEQDGDAELSRLFKPLADELAAKEAVIADELLSAQGEKIDIGGYYKPDEDLMGRAMRPSRTFNKALEMISVTQEPLDPGCRLIMILIMIEIDPDQAAAAAAAVPDYRLFSSLFIQIILTFPVGRPAFGAAGQFYKLPAAHAFKAHRVLFIAEGGTIEP